MYFRLEVVTRFVPTAAELRGIIVNIKYISMDMSPAFISGAKEYFPDAKVVFDKFHVVKMANDTIDKVRRKEYEKNK